MKWAIGSGLLILVALILAGCVQELPRQVNGDTTGKTQTPVTPISTTPVLTAIATATLVPLHTPTPSPTPTVTPTETPTPTALPDITPTATSASSSNNEVGILEVRGPEDGAIVQSDGVVVHGVAGADAELSINGKSVPVSSDGRFQTVVDLAPGANEIQVVAEYDGGLSNHTVTLRVTSLLLPPQPFFLLVTQPKDQSIVSQSEILMAGRTSPEAVVSVNGVSVPVDIVGVFSMVLQLDVGPNIIDVVATNVDGEVLGTVIAVIYRP